MKFLTLCLLALMTVACGKNVDTKSPKAPTLPPNNNPGVVTGQPLPPVGPSGIIRLTFANHAYDQYSADQIDSYSVNSKMVVNFPSTIAQSLDFSFDPDALRNHIYVTVNGDQVCEYRLNVNSDLQAASGCVQNLTLHPSDEISIEGIPAGETVRLKIDYQSI